MTTALVALALGAGVATACGDSGDRESVNQSNEGELTSEGSPSTVETGPATLGSTGEAQEPVTQEESTP